MYTRTLPRCWLQAGQCEIDAYARNGSRIGRKTRTIGGGRLPTTRARHQTRSGATVLDNFGGFMSDRDILAEREPAAPRRPGEAFREGLAPASVGADHFER